MAENSRDGLPKVLNHPPTMVDAFVKAVSGAPDQAAIIIGDEEASYRQYHAAGLTIDDIDCVKTHNPFVVNDIVFARETGWDVMNMNNYGCSLVWGHPNGPTGMRTVIELVEELKLRGGGKGLFTGCAAGDLGMAVIVEVDQRPLSS